MSIPAGTRLGSYEIVGALGAGGMGEVYRARDTKLGRDVALKVLPTEFALDAERLARFKREAQVLASLNDPHIAAIYGFEDAGGVHALVLELVEGPTLADRIAQGPVPLDEALPIARQIAEALEAAHEQGIIHRDLKPANIKVRPDGMVKVLDFGLAKLAEPGAGQPGGAGRAGEAGGFALSQSPTITTPAMMTGVGTILGTAAYMSPEQAKGRPADKRSDIWAFGCVLYEMLTGKRPFEGEDVSDTLAAVLRGHPDWTQLTRDVPKVLRVAIQQCLEKDRRRRIGDVSTIRFLLSEPTIADPGADSTPTTIVNGSTMWLRAGPLLFVTILAAALTSAAWWIARPHLASPTVMRFSYTLPDDQRFTDVFLPSLAISRDGTQMAYTANNRLYLRSIAELAARPITGTDVTGANNVGSPVFSPDGRSVAYWARTSQSSAVLGALKRIAVGGGVAVTLAENVDLPLGITWDGDTILVGQQKGVLRVAAEGGTAELLVALKAGEAAQGPQMLPGGDAVLFTLAPGGGPLPLRTAEEWDRAQVVVQSLKKNGERKVLVSGSDARYLPTGHLVYALGGVLFAVPFDARRLTVIGAGVPIVEGVSRTGLSSRNRTGSADAQISDGGALIYLPGPTSTPSESTDLVMFDRSGAAHSLKLPPGTYESPRVSPDGKQIAVGTDDSGQAIVWIYDLSGASRMRQLTFQGKNRFPIWSADGQRVAFQSDRDGDPAIFWQRADGGAPAERLTQLERGTNPVPESWSVDGKHLLFTTTQGSASSLWVFSLQDRKAERFGEVSSSVGVTPINPVFSPDGRWVAYVASAASTRAAAQLTVQPFPATGIRYLVANGGADPLWSPNGRDLFYADLLKGQSAVVSVTTQPRFAVGNPTPILENQTTRLARRGPGVKRNIDILPDGTGFIAAVPAGGEAYRPNIRRIDIVLNWFEELKQHVPTK